MWIPIPVKDSRSVALATGRYVLDLDNSLVRLDPSVLASLAPRLPVVKTWQGKRFTIHGLAVVGDVVRVDFTVNVNPLPLAVVLVSLGVGAALVASVFLVRELRRWLPVGEVVKSPAGLAVLGAGAVLVTGLVTKWGRR